MFTGQFGVFLGVFWNMWGYVGVFTILNMFGGILRGFWVFQGVFLLFWGAVEVLEVNCLRQFYFGSVIICGCLGSNFFGYFGVVLNVLGNVGAFLRFCGVSGVFLGVWGHFKLPVALCVSLVSYLIFVFVFSFICFIFCALGL